MKASQAGLLRILALCALSACAPDGKELKSFQQKVLRIDVQDPAVGRYELVLEHDVTESCEALSSGTVAKHNGQQLPQVGRGGAPQEGGCLFPAWTLARPASLSGPLSVIEISDASESTSAQLKNLFVSPQLSLSSAPSARVGDGVEIEVAPGTELVKDLKVFFIAQGGTEQDGVVWWDGVQGEVSIELTRLTVMVPARQAPGSGRLVLTATTTAPFLSCQGFQRCTANLAPVRWEVPFTVQP